MGWFKELKQTLGFSKPDPGVQPQIDMTKKGLNDKVGGYLATNFQPTISNYSNEQYYSPPKAQEIQAQRASTPTASGEAARSISAYRPGGNQAGSQPQMVYQPGTGAGVQGKWVQQGGNQQPEISEAARRISTSNEAGYNPDLSNANSLQAEAYKRAMAQQAPTQTGYDPSIKAAALSELNQSAETETQKALKIAREAMGSKGILNSSVAGAKAGEIASEIAARKLSAINDLNTKDAEAQREDRYRNAGLSSQQISQLSGLGQDSQNMSLNAGTFNRQGRQMDIASQTAAQEFERTGNQIDSAEAMKRAEFARQGGQMDAAEAWRKYAADQEQNNASQSERVRVQTQNINAQDLGNQRKDDQYQNFLKQIQAYTSGSAYTPESEAAALADAQRKQEQQNRLSSTVGLIGSFIK